MSHEKYIKTAASYVKLREYNISFLHNIRETAFEYDNTILTKIIKDDISYYCSS